MFQLLLLDIKICFAITDGRISFDSRNLNGNRIEQYYHRYIKPDIKQEKISDESVTSPQKDEERKLLRWTEIKDSNSNRPIQANSVIPEVLNRESKNRQSLKKSFKFKLWQKYHSNDDKIFAPNLEDYFVINSSDNVPRPNKLVQASIL